MAPSPIPTTDERLAALERELQTMKRLLDKNVPGWNTPPLDVPIGSSGSMTLNPPPETFVGYVTPKTTDGARVRSSASTVPTDNIMYTLPFGGDRKIVGVIADYNGRPYKWYITDDNGYVREDVVTFSVKKPAPPAPVSGKWPAPVSGYTITNTHHNHRGHEGVDLAADIGTPIYSAPISGTVVKVFVCTSCNPQGDGPASLNDKNKAYGYGTYVIVRYDHHSLPLATRLAMNGFTDLFVLFAHLQVVIVREGQSVTASQELGRVGSTGNSSGPHLHIECRCSSDSNPEWYSIRGNAINPSEVFEI